MARPTFDEVKGFADHILLAMLVSQQESDGTAITEADHPATKLVAVTPSDATDLTASNLRALWVGTGGDLSLIATTDSTAVTIANVPDGTLIPIAAKKVMAATTAADIVGLA